MNVAILGSGQIARDLYRKIGLSDSLNLHLVAGRNAESPGMIEAAQFSDHVSDRGVAGIEAFSKELGLVFDATSAKTHLEFMDVISPLDLRCVDLTPSGNGKVIVPALNISDSLPEMDVNLVSCGGQACIPMVDAVIRAARSHGITIDYVEVISVVSALSAGPATRENLDNYILSTERALSLFCDCPVKVLFNVNPADPPVTMQNSISFRMSNPADKVLWGEITEDVARAVRQYVPGYTLLVRPHVIGDDRLFLSLTVQGEGHYLPEYAGNLDIITSAAVRVAEFLSENEG